MVLIQITLRTINARLENIITRHQYSLVKLSTRFRIRSSGEPEGWLGEMIRFKPLETSLKTKARVDFTFNVHFL